MVILFLSPINLRLLTPNTFSLLQTAQHTHIVFKGVQNDVQKWFSSPVLVTGSKPTALLLH
jgi:hypothetical protein